MNSTASQIAILTPDDLETPPLSLSQLARRRFQRHKPAIIGLVVLALLVLYALAGSLFISEKYANYNDTSLRLQGPSAVHPFGTDSIGRDVLARTIYGGQISLLIGLTAVVVETFLGILVGAMAGYYGGVGGQYFDAHHRSHAKYPRDLPVDRDGQVFWREDPGVNSLWSHI